MIPETSAPLSDLVKLVGENEKMFSRQAKWPIFTRGLIIYLFFSPQTTAVC